MVRINLFVKYLACYILIVISSIFILNTFGVSRIRQGVIGDRVSSMRKEAEDISDNYIKNYYSGDMSIESVRKSLKVIDSFAKIRIMIVSADGYVISDTRGVLSAVGSNRNKLPEKFLEEDYYVGSFPGVADEDFAAVVYPIDMDFTLKGYVVLITAVADINTDVSYYMDTLNICLLILDAVFLIALFFLYRISIVPLRAVIRAAKEYSGGNLTYKLPVIKSRNDEFSDLMVAIEYMATELNLTEEYRRRFISNISHDFRSPLTSIKGFATAMMDGTIPEELYNKYLNTICFETDRLTKLTGGLIEFGRFDSKEAMLDIRDFDLTDMIKKTAETFEGRCREKRISLNLIFEEEAEWVRADRGKFEQVLYNLIDNAIKFSHNDSDINVSAAARGNKILVSVKDYGVGIPKESIKKIWDRFYKTDASRGKDKKGSGLGLSIVKEIIQAHGEEINVISTKNAGTEFIFTLSRAGV